MGNLFSNNRKSQYAYEPFLGVHSSGGNARVQPQQTPDIKDLLDRNNQLEEEIKIIKRELAAQLERRDRQDSLIQSRFMELSCIISDNKEKINIITKDMENLLNNDKILLDKLIEKNIVSTIQE